MDQLPDANVHRFQTLTGELCRLNDEITAHDGRIGLAVDRADGMQNQLAHLGQMIVEVNNKVETNSTTNSTPV